MQLYTDDELLESHIKWLNEDHEHCNPRLWRILRVMKNQNDTKSKRKLRFERTLTTIVVLLLALPMAIGYDKELMPEDVFNAVVLLFLLNGKSWG